MKIALSKLNRRSFFGVAAASPLAIGGVAKEVEKMSLGYVGELGVGSCGEPQPCAPDENWMAGRIARIRDELLNLQRPNIEHRGVNRLDPDLTASRSFSLSGRMNIQRERDADRELARTRGYLERELASLLSVSAKKLF